MGHERGIPYIFTNSKNCPNTYLKLTDLRAILHLTNEYASSTTEFLQLEKDALARLGSLASRAGNTLVELQQFIDNKLIKKTGTDRNGNPFLSKRAWLQHESKIKIFRERLRDCRFGISMHLSLINTRSMYVFNFNMGLHVVLRDTYLPCPRPP